MGRKTDENILKQRLKVNEACQPEILFTEEVANAGCVDSRLWRTRGVHRATDAAPMLLWLMNWLIFHSDLGILSRKFFSREMTAVQANAEERLVTTNRKARHDFTILETYEAGIVLTGTEVKSLRLGNANLSDGYAIVKNGEAWLIGMHVSPYQQGSYANVDPVRIRKLLLHKKEIRKLLGRLKENGVTLIPLKVYFKQSLAKVLLGVAKGKRAYDKRHDIAKREAERAIRQRYAR